LGINENENLWFVANTKIEWELEGTPNKIRPT
jgi:hypothetical protein